MNRLHALPSLVVGCLLLAAVFLGCEFGSDGGSSGAQENQNLQGLLEVDVFNVPAGEVWTVAGDLRVVSTGSIQIDGDLIADSDAGQNIALEARDAIAVSGRIVAGNGGQGQSGGSVRLFSTAGDILLLGEAELAAGDGGTAAWTLARMETQADGSIREVRGLTGGQGLAGGSLVLGAPEGRIQLPATESFLRLGNGGPGAEISLEGDDAEAGDIPEQLPNAGGDAGALLVESGELTGLEAELLVLDEDLLNAQGQVWAAAGSVLPFFPDALPLAGGQGGNAGGFVWNATGLVRGTVGKTAWREVADRIPIKGAPGGQGLNGNGGDGAPVMATLGDLAMGKPPSIELVGGKGGNALSLTGAACVPGMGGFVYGKAYRGADGATGADGVPGGEITGFGGDGGDLQTYDRNAKKLLVEARKGLPGSVHVYGGQGGSGGGKCPDDVVDSGGDGASGGQAIAYGGNFPRNGAGEPDLLGDWSQTGWAQADGGWGGDCGSGLLHTGDVGQGGIAQAYGSAPGSSSLNGGVGSYGCETCPSFIFRVDPASGTLDVGEGMAFTALFGATEATLQDVSASDTNWSSSDPAVASVDQGGQAQCLADGTAIITANHSFLSGELQKTVSDTSVLICNEISCDPSSGGGQWTGEVDAKCDGGYFIVQYVFYADGTFTRSDGNDGTWSVKNGVLTLEHKQGSKFSGTINKDCDEAEGDYTHPGQDGGCWRLYR